MSNVGTKVDRRKVVSEGDRRRVPPERQYVLLNATIPPEMKRGIQAEADARGQNVSAYVREALRIGRRVLAAEG